MTRALFAATCALLAGACDRPDPGPDPVPDTPAGAQWALEELNAVTGPTARTPFGNVHGLALHSDGRLAVVDERNRVVSVFGAHGGYGEPAGEFGATAGGYKHPYSAAWLADTLAIYDPEMNRVLFLRDARTPLGNAPAIKLVGAITARFYPVSPQTAFLRTMIPTGSTFQPAFVEFLSRAPSDTVAIAAPAPLANGTICRYPNNTPIWFDWPEAPLDLVVPVRADGAVAVARTDEYRVIVLGRSGDTITVLRRPFERVPIPDAEWNERLKAYTDWVARYGIESCEAAPKRPAHRVPVRAIAVSAEGEVWVTSIGPAGLLFDVYTLDGTRRATLPAPAHLTAVPISVAGDRLSLATQRADSAYVVRTYRITRGTASDAASAASGAAN